jgi:hypothetical protein
VQGCTLRTCKVEIFDIDGKPILKGLYQTVHIATDVDVDDFKLNIPKKIIEFNRFKQDNDSVKIITPYGMVESEKTK